MTGSVKKQYFKPYSVVQTKQVTATTAATAQSFSTYNDRKFSDYDLLLFVGSNSYTLKDLRATSVIYPGAFAQNGNWIGLLCFHGATFNDKSGLTITYTSETSVTAYMSGSSALCYFTIIGVEIG